MKKSRLLEIIREEIAGALNELTQITSATKTSELNAISKAEGIPAQDVTNAYNQARKSGKPINVAEIELDEDILMEAPFIGGSLDFAYIDGKIEKGILGKAIAKATQEIQNAFPEADPDATTRIVTSKKSRTSEKTPKSVKTALEQIDDTLEAQADTFDNINLLKKIKDSKDFSTDEQVAIENYIEKATVPDEKTGKVKQYTYNLGFPQTLRAVEKTLSGEAPSDVEPDITPKSANKPAKEKESEKEEPRKATLTKGDDGFDDVSYSKPKKEEPKKSEPKKEKEEGPKSTSVKSDKMSDKKDELLKSQKEVANKMKELAQKMKEAEGKEKDKIMDELKKVNKEKAEIDKKIDKLGY